MSIYPCPLSIHTHAQLLIAMPFMIASISAHSFTQMFQMQTYLLYPAGWTCPSGVLYKTSVSIQNRACK